MTKGILGSIFDINRDGEMSVFERAAEFAFLSDLLSEEEKAEKLVDLELEGLDLDELSMMDDWERREALEEAGLDPDDYDFD